MKIDKIVVLLLLNMFFVLNIFANNKQMEDLNKTLQNYIKAQKEVNIQKITDYTYDGLYRVISKEEIIRSMQMAMSLGMNPKIEKFDILNVGSIKKYSKGFYSIVKYNTVMSMNLPVKSKDMIVDILLPQIKSTLPKELSVSYNEKSNEINMKGNLNLVSIDENKKGWKFLTYEQVAMLKKESVIPSEIRNNIKK